VKNCNVDQLGDEAACAYNFVGGMRNYYRAPYSTLVLTGAE
jgi:hypothetical protein